MTAPRASLAFFFAACVWPSVALAGARPVRVVPPALPSLNVEGAAHVSEMQVEVRCSGPLERTTCTVGASFVVTAVDEIVLRQTSTAPTAGSELRIDGAPLGATNAAHVAGTAVHVSIDATRVMRSTTDWNGAPWIVAPMLVRHPFLGRSTFVTRSADSFGGQLVTGDVTLDGPIHVDTSRAGGVTVQVAGTSVERSADVTATTTSVDVAQVVAANEPPIVHLGGPLLAAGARYDLARANDDGRFVLRAGFEVGMTEWMFASASIETDFDSLMQSVLLEGALPEVFFFIPSFAGGIGVVARELGPRDADVGLRLHAQMNLSVVGLAIDGDYWPSVGTWTLTMAGIISI